MADKRPSYSEDFRASAIAFLDAAGYPNTPGAAERVAKRFGIPRRTLERWYKGEQNQAPDKLVQVKKGELSDMIRQEAEDVLAAMGTKREEAHYRDLVVALGILVDKLQLLTGKPTGNTKTEVVIRRVGSVPRPSGEAAVADPGSPGSEPL